MQATVSSKHRFSVQKMVKIAILGAVATILMLFEIPLWFVPSFYEIDLSEVVVLIGAFSMGPIAGTLIELIKILLNFVLNGTITAGVGEAANFLIGLSMMLPSVWIYRRYKTIKTAVFGMGVGVLSMTVFSVLVNYFVLLPTYSSAMGLPLAELVGMGTALNSWITDLFTFVLFAVAPFNLIKGIITMALTLLLYKRISPILK